MKEFLSFQWFTAEESDFEVFNRDAFLAEKKCLALISERMKRGIMDLMFKSADVSNFDDTFCTQVF